MNDIKELIARWGSGEGKPYKGSLIDWDAWKKTHETCAMCAQGQVLHLYGGWEPKRLRDTEQGQADIETASLLNISRAHAVLLRNINDKQDGAPSIVLTDPGKVLGDKWSKLLDFWWLFHQFTPGQWREVAAARTAAGDPAGDAARTAAGTAARIAARTAAGTAARIAARTAAGTAAGDAAWGAAGTAAGDAAWGAAWEIQGFELLGQRGHDVSFLPMFGIKTLDDIPPRPGNYGLGIVPND